jgi:hypothetical protein
VRLRATIEEDTPVTTAKDRAQTKDTQGGNGSAAGGPFRPDDATMQRAEEIVDRVVERVSSVVARVGHRMQKFTARAREEAEDFWAEVQEIRRGDRR